MRQKEIMSKQKICLAAFEEFLTNGNLLIRIGRNTKNRPDRKVPKWDYVKPNRSRLSLFLLWVLFDVKTW
jgi:hypothetical protein